MVRVPADDAADHLVVADAPHQPLDRLPSEPPPVDVQAEAYGGVVEEGGCPLYCVYPRQQRRVYKPGTVEQVVVGPARVFGAQPVADRVVLEGEERVHHGQADPKARLVGGMLLGSAIYGYQAVGPNL